MRTEAILDKTRIIIDPGELYVSNKDVIISTLVGSCVAVCLCDNIQGVIGMNHFLMSSPKNDLKTQESTSNPSRYGTCAMEILIDNMLKSGAQKRNLKAKAFGGGAVLQNGLAKDGVNRVGEDNIQFIKKYLMLEKIHLVGADLGGDSGRVIHLFNDFSVFVRKISRQTGTPIYKRERELLKRYLIEKTRNVT
ncbi:chemotaxis protein CheD [Deltaproteobacteria bacterium TL4]